MIEITFTSETLQELAEQAAQFANTVNGEAKSAKTSRTNKGKQAPPAETPPETPTEKTPEPEAPKPDTKKLEKTKEEALDVLRKVYGKGENGVLQVRNILRHFDVKKAGDVPVEKADELAAKAQAAFKLVTEADTSDEDAPI